MKSRFQIWLSGMLVLGLLAGAVSLLSGCRKKSGSASPVTGSRLNASDRTKNLPLSQLIPPPGNRTGKREMEVELQVKDDYMYGTLAGQYGRLQVAVKYLTKALKAQPDFIDAHHNLGLAYYKLGRQDDAVAEWRQALRLDPTFAETYYNLGIFLMDNGRKDDGIKLFQECIKHDSYHLKSRYALGKIAQDAGNYQEAIRHYKSYQQRDKGDLKVHMALGETYLLAGMIESSQREFESAAKIDEKNPMIHYQLGVAYHRSNRIAEAIHEYQRATELAPDLIDGFVNLGDLHIHRREYAKALRAFNSALGIDSRNAYARKRAGEMEKKLLETK